jgi:hypothetical protein
LRQVKRSKKLAENAAQSQYSDMGEDIPMGEKIAAEAKGGKKLRKQNPWLLVSAIVAVIGLGGFWEYEQHVAIAGQKSKIDALETKLTEKENQIRDQADELLPLRVYAIGKFGGDERHALAQLAEELQETFQPLDAPTRKKTVAAFRETLIKAEFSNFSYCRWKMIPQRRKIVAGSLG